MLTGDEITFLTRMGERLLGMIIGGMSVLLGYRLFTKLPEKTDSSGRLILPGGVSIWLSRVGPGVFFALFGAAIVATAFKQGIELTSRVAVATTDPGGASKLTEETRSRRGVASSAPESESEIERRVKEARTQIFTLNRDWPNALRKELHGDDRKVLEVARDYAKRQILHAVWLPRWGSPAEFETWVNGGARIPPPAAISEPAGIYLEGLEGSP